MRLMKQYDCCMSQFKFIASREMINLVKLKYRDHWSLTFEMSERLNTQTLKTRYHNKMNMRKQNTFCSLRNNPRGPRNYSQKDAGNFL